MVGMLEYDEKQKGEHLDLYGGSLVEMQKYTKLQAVLFQVACFYENRDTSFLLSRGFKTTVLVLIAHVS